MGNPPPPSHSPSRAPARLVRELVPFVLLACACGAAVRQPATQPTPALPQPSAAPAPDASAVSAESRAVFDALAARGPSVAPGMREVTRKEGGADAVDLVKADARDTCVRAAYEASAPVTARLVDQAGHVLAGANAASTDGVLGEHGPVCVRKGDVVRGIAEGAGGRVRWVAWEAP
jgi:hypothetical protein